MKDLSRIELLRGYGLTCRDCAYSTVRSGFLFCNRKQDIMEKDNPVCKGYEPRRKYGAK